MSQKTNNQAKQTPLTEIGLDQFWAEIFRPGSPLAFLTAQGLRVAQPVLSAFTTNPAFELLAQQLESPAPKESNQ